MWNTDPLSTDFDLDFGDVCEPLRPIHLAGAANGSYSGKVMVGSTKPIVGLRATASELKGEGGGWPWVWHAHHGRAEMYGIARMGYYTHVWGGEYAKDTSLFGWKSGALHAHFNRGDNNGAPPARWRRSAEMEIAGAQRGIGRLGADFWPVLKDKPAGRATRRSESPWRLVARGVSARFFHYRLPGTKNQSPITSHQSPVACYLSAFIRVHPCRICLASSRRAWNSSGGRKRPPVVQMI